VSLGFKSKWIFISFVSFVVIWVGTDFGLWYSALVIGFLSALVLRRTWPSLTAAWMASVGAWGLQLLWQARSAPIGRAAAAVTGMMGFGKAAFVTILLTLMVAFLMATCGAWLGVTAVSWFRQIRS
jgi:hypothetical protein